MEQGKLSGRKNKKEPGAKKAEKGAMENGKKEYRKIEGSRENRVKYQREQGA